MTAVAPQRTAEQRNAALDYANEIRTERAALKQKIRFGTVRLEDILEDPPECAMSARVTEMLMCVRRIGVIKAEKILEQCAISPHKRLAGLSQRQKVELAAALRWPE